MTMRSFSSWFVLLTKADEGSKLSAANAITARLSEGAVPGMEAIAAASSRYDVVIGSELEEDCDATSDEREEEALVIKVETTRPPRAVVGNFWASGYASLSTREMVSVGEADEST